MLAKLNAFALVGIEAVAVEVEVDAAAGVAKTILVGLPELAVRESIHRIERALANLGYHRPSGRTVINLAPADLKKDAGAFGLPIAIRMELGCERDAARLTARSRRPANENLSTRQPVSLRRLGPGHCSLTLTAAGDGFAGVEAFASLLGGGGFRLLNARFVATAWAFVRSGAFRRGFRLIAHRGFSKEFAAGKLSAQSGPISVSNLLVRALGCSRSRVLGRAHFDAERYLVALLRSAGYDCPLDSPPSPEPPLRCSRS